MVVDKVSEKNIDNVLLELCKTDQRIISACNSVSKQFMNDVDAEDINSSYIDEALRKASEFEDLAAGCCSFEYADSLRASYKSKN